MLDYDTYDEFRDPEIYDLECDSYTTDIPLVEEWVKKQGGPLLDLGCGTGRMAIHLALQGYAVTGVDLMPEMIAHARLKAEKRGVSIPFVVSDARDFHLGQQYSLIFMLMHVFQFLYTRHDYEALFACVREHLQPDGAFLFITRNPNEANLKPQPLYEGDRFTLPDGGHLISMEEHFYDPLAQIQHYTRQMQFYHAGGRQVEKTIRVGLRYVYPQEAEALLHYNGLKVDTVYGSWQGTPLTPDSPSMIYVCRKA